MTTFQSKATWKDVLRFTVHHWRRHRHLGAAAAVLMLLSVVLDSFIPLYIGRLVDVMGQAQPLAGVMPPDVVSAAWGAFFGFLLLSVFNQSFRLLSVFLWNKFAARNLYDIQVEGLWKVQRFSADWHANSFAGGTVRKITRGMWAFDNFEDQILMGLLPAITIMISITTILAVKLPWVGVVAAVMILLYCGVSIWLSVCFLAPRFRRSAEADTKVGATLADIVTGNPTVKSFAAEEREDETFRGVAQNWRRLSLNAWTMGVSADAVRSLLRVAMLAALVVTTIALWKEGRASSGDIVMVVTSFFVIGGYLRDIGNQIAQIQRAVSDMEDVVLFWLREEDVCNAPDAEPLRLPAEAASSEAAFISFDNVSFSYPGSSALIYDGLSVDIRRGENVALVGPSGSGKSTFVKLLQRLYDVTGGRILISGQDISRVTLESLRRSIALVPQDPVLFHRSLAENIAYGRPDATAAEIEDAARKAFAHDFIARLPLGYGTLVGERGVKLSGGERQRVAIARAILSQAPILILDEATSSLDSISEHYIQKALDQLMAGRTTITIAHRLSTVQRADRILVFDRGRIVEQGSHGTLMSNPQSHYKVLYDMQALGLVSGGEDS